MRRLTISRKTLLAMLGLAIPSLLLFTVLTLTATADILRRNSTRQIGELADHSVHSLQQLVGRSKTTLMTITATPGVHNYLRWRTEGKAAAWSEVLGRLEESFLDFQQLDPSIQAIRLLDEDGNVLVKVREGVVIPPQKDKGSTQGPPLVESLKNRDFFQGTMVLQQGEVWISNMERGKVEGEEYWCPAMVRFSTPLFLPDGRRAVILDAGVNHLFTAFWYNHDVFPTRHLSGRPEETVLYGPLCMNIDVMRNSVMLPPVNVGDTLIFSPVGAYNNTQWLQFIEYRPNVVLVQENGNVSLIREAENLDIVIQQEHIPEHLDKPYPKGTPRNFLKPH